MNKLGSEFLKEFGNYERPILGDFTFRQVILILGIVLSGLVTTGIIILELPTIFMFLANILIVPPFAIFGVGLDKKLKEQIKYMFTIQTRVYQTEFDNERSYTANDFIQEKFVKETDEI